MISGNPYRNPAGNRLFALMWLAASMVLAYPLLGFPKGTFELAVNQHHHPALDFAFRYLTYLGDGTLLLILLVITLLYNYRLFILTGLTALILSLLMLVFKQWLFKGLPRPRAFFGDSVSLHFVEGVEVYYANTFPSGHTATAFAIAAILASLSGKDKKTMSAGLFILACLAGFSRVYLMQHFLVDVFAGAAVGLMSHWIARVVYFSLMQNADPVVPGGLLKQRKA